MKKIKINKKINYLMQFHLALLIIIMMIFQLNARINWIILIKINAI